MIKGRYTIAVCLSKIYSDKVTAGLESLRRYAENADIQVLVFHSLTEQLFSKGADAGSRAVFDLLSYDVIDALVVLPNQIRSSSMLQKLADKAHEMGKPVFSYGAESSYADISFTRDYNTAIRQLIEHVLTVHSVQYPYLIINYKDENYSLTVKDIFRQVLETHGLDYVEAENVGIGEGHSDPTAAMLCSTFGSSAERPDAYICVYDTMVPGVYAALDEFGDKHEDIVVAACDCREYNSCTIPSYTCCREDYDDNVRVMVEKILQHIESEDKKHETVALSNEVYIAESCGCRKPSMERYARQMRALYSEYSTAPGSDEYWNDMVSGMSELTSMKDAIQFMFKYLPERSIICTKPDLFDGDHNETPLSEYSEMEIICGKWDNAELIPSSNFSRTDILPALENHEWGNVQVISAICFGKNIYGYMIKELTGETGETRRLHKCIVNLDNAVSTLSANVIRMSLLSAVERISYVDHITGLRNYKGLEKEFVDVAAKLADKTSIAVSIYAVRNLTDYIRNNGINEADAALAYIANALEKANEENSLVGRFAEGEFVVVNFVPEDQSRDEVIVHGVSTFYGAMSEFNSNPQYHPIEVNAGCTVADPGWYGDLEGFIKLATNQLIINKLRGSAEHEDELKKYSSEYFEKFIKLVDENLFYYVFQPIVGVPSGEVVAYEALMRSTDEIGMNPAQIVEVARIMGRLYDIEKATMVNVFETYKQRREEFKGRKIFINSIPGNQLIEIDFEALVTNYHEYMENIVIEMTEQFGTSDDDMNRFMNTIRQQGWWYAVDDYGTGNSNVVNLLKFKPNLIKIDRYLVTDIDSDINKQLFVKNLIDYAKSNDIKVLAEGVETSEELRTVVSYGVDYIQGFYTARPSVEVVDKIPDEIREEIIEESKKREA